MALAPTMFHLGSPRFSAAAHEKYGDGTRARDVFGVASHENAAQAAPTVRAAHDEIGRPLARLREDEIAGMLARRVDQLAVDLLETCGACRRFRLMHDRLAGAARLREDFFNHLGGCA